MQFKTFLQYQCHHYWLRWRWLLPVLCGLLLGYWACYVIKVLNPYEWVGAPDGSVLKGNALEAFIWAFGKPEIVYFVVTALYIYLVSDYLPAPVYEQWILVRLASRSMWWGAKAVLVLLSTLLYALLLFGSFFGIVLSRYLFSTEWSPAALGNYGIGLGYAIKNGGPLQGAISTGLFLVVGWFAIGLLILVINQLSQKSWAGFLGAAVMIVLANLGTLTAGPIGGQGWGAYLLLQNHLEYTPLWAPTRVIPEAASWIFWLVWIGLCGAAGWFFSKRADILTSEA
jgi:hypothetical protein